MVLLKDRKKNIIDTFKTHSMDTGSADVQIALLTERIGLLAGHFKQHKKDFHSRRGLLMLVCRRRRLLDYIKKRDIEKYEKIIEKLNLRK